MSSIRNTFFYLCKPFIPRRIQIFLRRWLVFSKMHIYRKVWPINQQSGIAPSDWIGWPDGKRFALILTHDVEWKIGQARCKELAQVELERGFVASYNFVPMRYRDDPALRAYLVAHGFEIGVHDLAHDGKLFLSEAAFESRVFDINGYLQSWGAKGFRAGAMHHNLRWIRRLDIQYDMSTFDTDPFEPQSDGVNTIFPFWVRDDEGKERYLEMPYTLPQDFTLFVLMKEQSIDIWKDKLSWIAEKGGMALINTHPDYMNFSKRPNKLEEYNFSLYSQFLEHIKKEYNGQYWNVLPSEVVKYMKRT